MTALTYPERVEQTYVLAMTMLDLDVPAMDVARYLDDALANARYECRRDAVIARLDSYTQEQHTEGIRAARERAQTKRAARKARARAAAERLRRGGVS